MISLVGLPGSGKSTIGKLLARKLAFSFVDSDQVIESRLGCSIREYFEREGEERFRDVEQEVIAKLTLSDEGAEGIGHEDRCVLSTGGGAVIRLANRQTLRQRTRVVYLRASPEELFKRLRHDKSRPLLQVNDPMARLRELYEQRDPLYRDCAHVVIDGSRLGANGVVAKILAALPIAPPKLAGD